MTMRDSICTARASGPVTDASGVAVFEFRFAPDDPVFAGHFPGRPVLPGVFQLEMARVAAELVFNSPVTVTEIVKAKFLRPIAPGELVRLELKLTAANGTVQAFATFSVFGQPAGETLLRLCRPK